MEIQYVIINFIILAIILFLFGRKKIRSIFNSRFERINRELDEAEATEKIAMPVFEEYQHEEYDENSAEETIIARAVFDEKIAQIEEFSGHIHREIHREMIEDARKELFSIMRENVVKLFSYEKYQKEIRDLDTNIIDAILPQIKLTPGDMAYLKHHDVLYVTLMSAYPLDKAIVKKVDEVTTAMLDEVGGKTSLWVLEDPSLIGGLKLRIGDTVYDGTDAEELYQFSQNLLVFHNSLV